MRRKEEARGTLHVCLTFLLSVPSEGLKIWVGNQKYKNLTLRNIQRTRTIKGYFFYENLRPNQQLDVLGYKGFLQNLLKTFIFRIFSCHLPNWMKNFTPSRLFLYLYLASKGDQNTFYLFQS